MTTAPDLPDPAADRPDSLKTVSRHPCVRAEFDHMGNLVAIWTYVGGRGFQPITVDCKGAPVVERGDIADLVGQLQAQLERNR